MATVKQVQAGLPPTPKGVFVFRLSQVGEGTVTSDWGVKNRLFWQCEPKKVRITKQGKKPEDKPVVEWADVDTINGLGTAAVVITGTDYVERSANKAFIDALLGDRVPEWMAASGDTKSLHGIEFAAVCENVTKGNRTYANISKVVVNPKTLPADFAAVQTYGGADLDDPFLNDGFGGKSDETAGAFE